MNIDGEAIERTVNEMHKTMVKSIRTFADIKAVQQVGIDIKQQIDEFRPFISLIQSVRSPGMRPRHWQKFNEETGKSNKDEAINSPPHRLLYVMLW